MVKEVGVVDLRMLDKKGQVMKSRAKSLHWWQTSTQGTAQGNLSLQRDMSQRDE